jgi:hypothetical protein
LSHGREAPRRPRVGRPGKHWGYDRSVSGGTLHPARLTGSVRSEQGAIRGAGPGQPLAAPPCGVASSPPALGPQGPLLRRDRTATLQEPWIMGSIPQGTLDTRDPTPTLGEFLAQEPLGHIVTCETIRGGAQDTFKSGQGRPIPEAIETGAVAFGPALAVVARALLGGDVPSGVRRPRVVEATQWMCNRLLLLLTRRRDTGGQSDFHGRPPDDALEQDDGLRSVPSPSAEGTGMHHPPVVPRHAVLGLSGVHASLCA